MALGSLHHRTQLFLALYFALLTYAADDIQPAMAETAPAIHAPIAPYRPPRRRAFPYPHRFRNLDSRYLTIDLSQSCGCCGMANMMWRLAVLNVIGDTLNRSM